MIMKGLTRYFCTSIISFKSIKLNNAKNKSVSSQNWLKRQISDPYVEKAKVMNYRCRSAFKLIEINEKYNFFKSGQLVIDCGASPGSWTQIAVKQVNSDSSDSNKPIGTVISIDKQQIYPIEGAILLGNCDFTNNECQEKIRNVMKNRKADVVLSDMAPSATGIQSLDQENILQLCYSVLRFAVQVSKPGACVLMKLWQCAELKQLESDVGRFYTRVDIVKPRASRANSAEIFVLGTQFKGLKKFG